MQQLMDNLKILTLLEQQRDRLFEKLKVTSISRLYKEQYEDLKSGKVFVFDNKKKQMLSDLNKLSKDTSLDNSYKNKVAKYVSLDNESLLAHFQKEFDRVINEIINSGRQDEIQALFIEYDDYDYAISSITCYGPQDYPILEEPRYILGEYDYNKQVLFIEEGINFHPAWVDCGEFGNLDYLDINIDLQNLFQLHSRVLLHKALLNINDKLSFFKFRPVYFYINEHDNEEMTLYVLN